QYASRRHSEPLQGQAKRRQRRLVGLCLLRGNHIIEFDLQVAARGGEEVVINVGDDGEFVPPLEFLERCPSIRERLPVFGCLCHTVRLRSGDGNPEPSPESAHYITEHPAVTLVRALRFRLQLSVKLQNLPFAQLLPMGSQNRTQGAEQAAF